MFSETDMIKFLEFLIDNILCLLDVFFNIHSTIIFVPIVLLFSTTCSVIRTRQTSYRCFSRKTKKASPILSFHFPQYRWCPFT